MNSPAYLAVFGLGPAEIIMILVLFLLLFGGKKLPELARGLGKSLTEFKKATKEAETIADDAVNEDAPPASKPPAKPAPSPDKTHGQN